MVHQVLDVSLLRGDYAIAALLQTRAHQVALRRLMAVGHTLDTAVDGVAKGTSIPGWGCRFDLIHASGNGFAHQATVCLPKAGHARVCRLRNPLYQANKDTWNTG